MSVDGLLNFLPPIFPLFPGLFSRCFKVWRHLDLYHVPCARLMQGWYSGQFCNLSPISSSGFPKQEGGATIKDDVLTLKDKEKYRRMHFFSLLFNGLRLIRLELLRQRGEQ